MDGLLQVGPAWRRRGIGRQMIRWAIDASRVAGGCKLALCRRHGFREVGTCEKQARLDSHWRDAIIVEPLI